MSLSLKTYEQLIQMLRSHWLPSDTRARIVAELSSRNRTLANQTAAVMLDTGPL